MVGIARVTSRGVSGDFTLFGATVGVGAELNVTQNWSLAARLRYFNLGAGELKAQDQQVEGVIVTGGVTAKF